MKRTTIVKLIAITVTLAAIFAANTVKAQDRLYLVKPGVPSGHHGHHHHRELPKLGFYGYTTHRGMVITEVRRGTEAWRIGLEPGDVIVRVNGQQICHEGDYERALRRAYNCVDLEVRDVRRGGLHTLHANLESERPQYYNRPVVGYRGVPYSASR